MHTIARVVTTIGAITNKGTIQEQTQAHQKHDSDKTSGQNDETNDKQKAGQKQKAHHKYT